MKMIMHLGVFIPCIKVVPFATISTDPEPHMGPPQGDLKDVTPNCLTMWDKVRLRPI